MVDILIGITNYSRGWKQSTSLSIIYLDHEPVTMSNDLWKGQIVTNH